MDKAKLKAILDEVLNVADKALAGNPLAHLALGALRWVVDNSGLLDTAAKQCAAKGL